MSIIKNRQQLARTPAREAVLDIIEAGLAAVNTDEVISENIKLDGDSLTIKSQGFDLAKFKHIHLIGFGKISCDAAMALSKIFGAKITAGVTIGLNPQVCQNIKMCEATHPLPSPENVKHTGELLSQCENLTADDLVIVIVSGGGSSMLCWPQSECDQSARLYDAASQAGLDIQELNTIRKHISAVKGGGLAKSLYPATVVGLIFSDVPGSHPEIVASGPTYFDYSTVADAQAIIDKYKLGQFDLLETPKDQEIFKSVTNIVIVSNQTALDAMAAKAESLGYSAKLVGNDFSGSPENLVKIMEEESATKSVVLIGGESKFTLPADHGTGGRNQQNTLVAIKAINEKQIFSSVASDGKDNGDFAGAMIDYSTAATVQAEFPALSESIARRDSEPVLEAVGELIETGSTKANVADLTVLLTE